MTGRGMRPLARAVDRLLQGLGIASDVARMDAVEAWADVASAVLGPDASSTRALRADGATLVVAVPTSAWASELRMREAEIVERLARAAPRSGITRIRVVPEHRPSAR